MTPDTPRVVPAKRGYAVFYEGKALLSTRDPATACERLVAALSKDERTLYLCVSPLFGYGLPRLLDTMRPSSAILCVETEPPLADFTRRHLPPDLTRHPRFALAADPTDDVLAAVFARWGHRVFRRVVRFDLSSAAALHPVRYRNIEEILRREIALEWENAATLMKLGRRYALNFLRNLRLLGTVPSVETFRLLSEENDKGGKHPPCLQPSRNYKPVRACSFAPSSGTPLCGESPATPPDPGEGPVLGGGACPRRRGLSPSGGDCPQWRGLSPAEGAVSTRWGLSPRDGACPPARGLSPAEGPVPASRVIHVLGAGPSLDRFFTDYSGGSIVCVDTALPALRSHGLKASLAVTLEAQHWNLRDFIGCRDTARALAMDMSALPVTADCVDGPTYLFFTPWTPLRIFDRLRGLLPLEIPPLGNVGITAYTLANCLFRGIIVPHGLDFAFTIDQYHCRDSPGHIELLRRLDHLHSLFPVEAALRSSTFAAVNDRGKPIRQDPVMRRYRGLFLTVQHNGISAVTPPSPAKRETATAFTRTIRFELTRIRNILSGQEKASSTELAALLNTNDFLFAHYPDYAGTQNPANIEDISFLKRIRAEIDAFIQAVTEV
ncbi:MAG: DUF115 domain-containing protein [Spirochaetaceae bacterium]|jgi:hypothetical protein|nr:DUF115 domain-containing protein [Spirochaetaceae bacterium]